MANTPDEEVPFSERNQFPDAERQTVAFYLRCNIRALRRILDHAKTIPTLEIDAHDVWDAARQFFPEEFGKVPAVGRIKPAAIQSAEIQEVKESSEVVPTNILQCRYCGKPASSTSGKTLHEKVCKKRPQ